MYEVRVLIGGEWQTLRFDPSKDNEFNYAAEQARAMARDLWDNGWSAKLFRDGEEIDRFDW